MVYILFSDRIWQKAIFKGWERLMIWLQPLENETKLVWSPRNSIQEIMCVCVCVRVCASVTYNKYWVTEHYPQVIVFYFINITTMGNEEN